MTHIIDLVPTLIRPRLGQHLLHPLRILFLRISRIGDPRSGAECKFERFDETMYVERVGQPACLGDIEGAEDVE